MKTVIHIKIDKEVKEMAQKAARDLGIPLSTVVSANLKQFSREKELYLSMGLHPSPRLEKVLAEAEKDMLENKNIVGPFRSAKEMLASLNS